MHSFFLFCYPDWLLHFKMTETMNEWSNDWGAEVDKKSKRKKRLLDTHFFASLFDSTLQERSPTKRTTKDTFNRRWASVANYLSIVLFRVGHLPHLCDSGRRKRTRGPPPLMLVPSPHHLPLKIQPNSTWPPPALRCRCSPSGQWMKTLSGPASALAGRSCTGTRRSRRVSSGIAEPPEGFIRRRIVEKELFSCHPGEMNLNENTASIVWWQ